MGRLLSHPSSSSLCTQKIECFWCHIVDTASQIVGLFGDLPWSLSTGYQGNHWCLISFLFALATCCKRQIKCQSVKCARLFPRFSQSDKCAFMSDCLWVHDKYEVHTRQRQKFSFTCFLFCMKCGVVTILGGRNFKIVYEITPYLCECTYTPSRS